jgi:hypothetical protein
VVEPLKVPQADDITKIIDLPMGVANGDNTPESISKRYRFARRQALYYLEAAEALGLIIKHGRRYSLSREGRRYVSLDGAEKREILARKILTLPIFCSIISELLLVRTHRLSYTEIESMVSRLAGMSTTTTRRRAQTLFRWLAWVERETGVLRTGRKEISLRLKQV